MHTQVYMNNVFGFCSLIVASSFFISLIATKSNLNYPSRIPRALCACVWPLGRFFFLQWPKARPSAVSWFQHDVSRAIRHQRFAIWNVSQLLSIVKFEKLKYGCENTIRPTSMSIQSKSINSYDIHVHMYRLSVVICLLSPCGVLSRNGQYWKRQQ